MGNNYNNEKFDSFLNKIIIFNSKAYFKKQMNVTDKEKTIINDENYTDFIQFFTNVDNQISFIETNVDLDRALKELSTIEQTVLFLLFKEELTQEDAGKILEICSKTVRNIKFKALDKLKKYLSGGNYNEK